MSSLLRASLALLLAAGLCVVPSSAGAVEAPFTVSGTVTTADGQSLADTGLLVQVLTLGDGFAYPTVQDSQLIAAGQSTTYSLDVPFPGPYVVRAIPLSAVGGPTRYLRAWYGGQGQPTLPTDPGVVSFDDSGAAATGIDVVLPVGAIVTGTVRSASGSPVAGATVQFERWLDDTTVGPLADVTGSISRDDGSWGLTVPTGIPLTLGVSGRSGYADWVLGGDRTTRTSDNTIVATLPGQTVDIDLTPAWGDLGATDAVVRDETCLARSGSGTADLGILRLDVASTGLVTDVDVDVDLGDDPLGADHPALVPYWTGTARTLTWGVSDDGTLCALWRGPSDGTVVQLLADPDEDGALDVTYAYGTVGPNPFVVEARAGWTDGSDAVILDRPYEDASGDGLAARSLDSEVPGRHRFRFDGFTDPAAANVELPTVSRAEAGDGIRLTAAPGSWEVPGGQQSDLTFSFQWLRRGEPIDGETGTSLVVDPAFGDAYAVRVTAQRAGFRSVPATSAPSYVAGAASVAPVTNPIVTGDPAAGSTLRATPGTWRADGAPTFTYEWTVGGEVRSTSPTIALSPADVGHDLDLTVVASLDGATDGTSYVRLGRVLPAGTELRDLATSVRDDDGGSVDGATVTACAVDTGVCRPAGPDGVVSRLAPGATYEVTATPRWDSGLIARSTRVTVPTEGPAAATVVLRPLVPRPDGVGLEPDWGDRDGVPVLYWGEEQSFTVAGCPGTTGASFTLTSADGVAAAAGTLTETDPGTFVGRFPSLADRRGYAAVTTDLPLACDGLDAAAFDVYVDPYGVVLDEYGRPVADAQVTLFRADAAEGPYTYVADGDEATLPGQSRNPDDTVEDGWYYWTPAPGWYVVEAAAPGCATSSSAPVEIDPPDLNVVVRLRCGQAAPTPTSPLTVTGPTTDARASSGRAAPAGATSVGATLTADGGTFAGPTTVQWLRGDQVVGTGRTYVVQPADAGHQVRARATTVRPDLVQDPGRGEPVSFRPARTTSEAVSVAAAPDGPTATTTPTPPPTTAPIGDGGAAGGAGGAADPPGATTGALPRTGAAVGALAALGLALLAVGATLDRHRRRAAPNL